MQFVRSILRQRDYVLGTALVGTLIVTLLSNSALSIYNFTVIGVYVIAVGGLNVITGQTGQINFAQGAFMFVGAYSVAILTTKNGWNNWLAVGAALIIAIGGGVLAGLILFRLRGHYLGVATLAVALGVAAFALGDQGLTNGGLGISRVPPLRIGHISLASERAFFILTWIVAILTLLLFALLKHSWLGRSWRALAVREDVAMSLGLNTYFLKIVAFVICSSLGAIAGILYVELTTFVSPDLFDLGFVINLFLVLFIGGRGATFGPVIGAVVLVYGPQVMSGFSPQFQSMIFEVLLLLIIIIRPQGILGSDRSALSIRSSVRIALRRRAAQHRAKKFGINQDHPAAAVSDVSTADSI